MKRKILALICSAMILATTSLSAFADSTASPSPNSLIALGEEYGFTVELIGEEEGLPVYEVDGISASELDQIIQEMNQISTFARCSHSDLFYYWDATREDCYDGSENTHTRRVKRSECLDCGLVRNEGDVDITNCPSGCVWR